MITDTNHKIKQYFNDFYKSAAEDAKSQANIFVEGLNLNILSNDQQVLRLYREIQLLNQKIDDFERKEYINFAAYDVIIYKIFSARLLFFSTKEDELIREGLVLSELRNHLLQLYELLKAQLPPLTFSDFLKNNKHVVFYDLHQKPQGISEDDYFKMRNLQTQKKIDCVNQESKLFKERFNAKIGENNLIASEIKAETKQLEYLFKNAKELTTDQFISELSKLIAIPSNSLPEDSSEFHTSFSKFIEGDLQLENLTPKFLNSELKKIKTGLISQVPICCWSFIKYDKWLNDLLIEKVTIDKFQDPDYNQIFNQTFKEGTELSEKEISEFKHRYPSDVNLLGKYHGIIIDKLNQLRAEFNQLAHPNYYHFLLEDETVKSYFVNNCFLGIDVEIHKEELKQAIVLNEMIVFFLEELERIHINPIDQTFNDFFLDLQITDLITSMIPEPDLMDQLVEVFSKTMSQLKRGRKPVLFIIDDLKDSLLDIYNQAADNLQQLFDLHPAEIKGHFASCQVRDMQHKELTASRNGSELHKYFEDLKDLFKIELEFVQSLQNINPINVDHLLHTPEVLVKEKFSFKYQKSDSKILEQIINELCLKIDFLDNKTTVKDFIRIVTSSDLDSISEKIYLGCQTNEFHYIIDNHFKNYFKSFKVSKVAKSGLFVSKGGFPFTKDNLYNAHYDNLQTKIKIDNIFNQKQ